MNKKILIVEDSLDMVYILQSQVKALGYSSVVAANGKQAVELAADQHPDLILLDIMMPVMDGLQATRLIRQNPRTSAIPILAVTARIALQDREECLQNGCSDYLPKPFTLEQLRERIENLLGQHSA